MRGTALPPGDPRQRRSIAWTPMGRRALIRGNLGLAAACQGAASNPVRKRAYRLPGLGHVVFVSQGNTLVHAPKLREARRPCLRIKPVEIFGADHPK